MAKPLSMIKPLLSFIFMFVPCLSCRAHKKQSLLQFKSNLLDMYHTSSSSSLGLESWDSNSDCCNWTRVVCSLHSHEITALHLGGLHLLFRYFLPNTKIWDPIYGIRSLTFLDISYSYIQGEIPGNGLANLTKLVHFDMSRNYFNGSIPPQLFHLRFLQFLDLSENLLKGGLSGEIGKLGNLKTLMLDHNFLDGNLPVQIGNLTKLRQFSVRNLTRLQQFSISHNKFLGRIPESILNLKELEKLDASNNYLEMHIPNRIGTLFHISILVLGVNRLTGSIPLSIRNLSKLETLRLEDNMLSGEIPSWLFDIDSLKNLYLGGNKFIWNNHVKIVPKCMLSQLSLKSCKISADIPEWISTQKNLNLLELSDNQLTGNFPLWIAEMEIECLLFSRNRLTGSIPFPLFQSQDLSVLDLSRNNFSGELPQNIGHALKLKVLMLSGNNFMGSIPKSIVDIPSLMVLDLSRNRLSGNMFPVMGTYRSPRYVDLSSNELSGDMPTSFGRGTSILALGKNKFSGFPKNVTHFVNLEYLDLHDNNITGDFLDFISRFSILHVLSLRNNSLHGSLPSNSFSKESRLQILDLSSNSLVGRIPSELGNLPRMSGFSSGYTIYNSIGEIQVNWLDATVTLFTSMYTFTIEMNELTVNWKNAMQGLSSHNRHIYTLLDLSNNKFSGDVPDSLGNLKGLKLLNLSYNKLSGYIPQSFGDLESIETLDLSYNNISGTIPQSFRKLDQLSVLDVSNNKLSGKIPRGGQMDTMNDPTYFANNSGLCGMQIRVKCSGDEPTPDDVQEEDDDVEQSHGSCGPECGSDSLLASFHQYQQPYYLGTLFCHHQNTTQFTIGTDETTLLFTIFLYTFM
ncbi:hypothetical protein DCAR_0934968 [Daucus carota subsp. sativus]|uniref:Leucine-rich repeat-containing N-terminal plant-type domain-containing protein n=1 Tax=Daucus carota subsp. sativus TaxID=79200 RepID=A0AAF1BEU2_DAUCS|nr:hypothetical protein DCAR_0934968 [Daucus carota subsp. sativus]